MRFALLRNHKWHSARFAEKKTNLACPVVFLQTADRASAVLLSHHPSLFNLFTQSL